MTKFCVVWRTQTTTANFYNLYFEFCTVFHIQFRSGLDEEKQTKRPKSIEGFAGCPRRRRRSFLNSRLFCLDSCQVVGHEKRSRDDHAWLS